MPLRHSEAKDECNEAEVEESETEILRLPRFARSLRMTMIGQSVFNPGRLRGQTWMVCPGLARG